MALVDHVLAAVAPLGSTNTLVVVGHDKELVSEHLKNKHPKVVTAVQAKQNGTGHAVKVALAELGKVSGPVLILAGDTPLLTSADL